MSVDLLSVRFGFVEDVNLLVVTQEHLRVQPSSGAANLREGRCTLTIIALTNVFPPSANEPAVAARAGVEMVARYQEKKGSVARIPRMLAV